MQVPKRELKGLNKIGSKSIDMLALAAALVWVAAMIGFSWWAGGNSILAWLIRGMWGAIFVYALTFLTLHAAVLKVRSLEKAAAEKEENKQKTIRERQAADGGQHVEMVAENVTE